MTGARKAYLPATIAVDFPCERGCQVEFDLHDIHIRFTLGMMLAAASDAHDLAHAEPPVKVFRARDEILVRATPSLMAAGAA